MKTFLRRGMKLETRRNRRHGVRPSPGAAMLKNGRLDFSRVSVMFTLQRPGTGALLFSVA